MYTAFRTDTDISHTRGAAAAPRERVLEAWQPPAADGAEPALHGDDVTFGGASNAHWDQFEANEQMFGVKTSFNEELYTTKLDRSRPDFKEKERKAQIIADEILGGVTSNSHLAEERGQKIDDSGLNEEDK
jgi:PAB1-binding protein PBP1